MDFQGLVRKNIDEDEGNDSHRQRLETITSKKIRTTMIGSLDVIEKTFGFLWGLDADGRDTHRELSEEELHMKSLFAEVRSKILDNGNQQISNFKAELSQYTVVWNRYTYKFEIRKDGDGNE
jgi:hypothetical protein